MPQAIALINNTQVLVCASNPWLDLLNPAHEEVVGNSFFDIYNQHNGIDKKKFLEQLKRNESFSVKHSLQSTTENQWFESTFSPWFDEKENIQGTIIHTEDITSAMEKDEELERIKNLLNAKSDIAKIGSWEYDIATERLSWSPRTKRIHQVPQSYTPNVADAIAFYKQGYSQNKISMLFHRALKEGIPFSKKLVIITQKGEERWVRVAGKSIIKDNKIVKIFGTFQDIHDQVITEIKSKENEKLLTTLIDNIPLNVYIKDRDSRKILVNKAECEYLEKKPKDLLGKTDFDLYDSKMAQISRDEDLEVMRTQTPILGKETISVRKNGSITNFLTSKIPFVDIEGKVNGIIGISMDISHLKKKEDQLRDLINVTAVQNKKLINFAHIVSHNLRSHTANFAMLLEFLVKEEDKAEKEKILDMLLQASDNLMLTLEDLNQVVAINNDINLEKKSIKLNDVINKVKQDLSTFINQNGIEIQNSITDDTLVQCVPAYLDSIILNLMTNAVKYRSPDRKPIITIDVQKRPQILILSVSDNGLGIDLNKHRDKIFGLYKTFHDRKDSRGLGLYITKNQVEAMGGKITVSSHVGEGTTFNVYFNEESQ
ncbi:MULTISPECIES: PAS domain-containing protein [Flavobacteriaceae]|uniref:PAS domain-containing sensor histidine kinase n=1 Tax=Flavobacteriaceae TaxID=49546 RepID=UPI001FE8C234|nr:MULTISPECIES: PAS domain-containing protein [Allomuricauda]MDC6366044.1 PAS domain-containing protein [Muricauda sp. AC10]